MVTYSRLLVRNPLSRPLNLEPGVPVNHIALKSLPGQAAAEMGGVMRFSAIMQNQATKAATALPTQLYPRYGLLGGINISGPTAINDGLIGAATVHAASGQNYAQWTNYVPPNDGTLTMAVILRLTATTGGFVCGSSTGGTTWAIMLSSGVPTFGIPFGTSASSGLPALQVGHAYFVACSTTSTTGSTTTSNKQTFVVRDLVTGITQTSQAATSVTLSAPTGGVQWGDAGGNNASSLGGYLAAMMFSNTFLTQQELRMWAQDPWSFWYPQSNNNLVTQILESIHTPPSGALPSGFQWYDLPIPTPPDRSYGFNRSYDLAPTPSTLLTGTKPFKQDDWPIPILPADGRRGEWNRSSDQSMLIWQQILNKSPNTGPTQDLPIPPFRPQVSYEQGSTQRLASIRSPITGPTQDLPIPPFRPQFSADQSMSIWQQILIRSPIVGPTQDLPIPPFRPQFSWDQSAQAPFAKPFKQDDWPLPIQPADQRRGEWNRSFDLGSTQWLSFGLKPFSQTEWPTPTPAFGPQFSYDQGTATFITVTATVPRNQYDWQLPIPFFRPNVSFDLGSTQWLNQGQKPFLQNEWPLTPPPFRPDVTFMPAAPLWLAPVFQPRNQYEWPLTPGSFQFNRSFDLGSTQWLNSGQQPFRQTEWPTTPGAPQFNRSFDVGTPSRFYALPFNFYDWQLPQAPFRPQVSYDQNLAQLLSSIMPPNPRFDWQNPLQPFRPIFGFDQSGLGLLSPVAVLPRNFYDWQLAIAQPRLDQTSFFFYNPGQMQTGKKPFAQTEWPLTPPYPMLPVSFYQIGGTFPGYMPATVKTVKIEWLIRARRRGRR